jgi:hypothetical protein
MNVDAAKLLNSVSWVVYDMAKSETTEKISSFGSLQSGWNFGEGEPSRPDLIQKAIEIDNLAHNLGFNKTDAFPGPDGEVRLCVYEACVYLEFTLELDGTITIISEIEGVETEKIGSMDSAREALRTLNIWNTSVLFIGDSGTSNVKISKAWHSKTPPATGAFLWWTESAQNTVGKPSVPGSTGFTKFTPHVLLSGASTKNYFRKKQKSPMNPAILGMNVIGTCAA